MTICGPSNEEDDFRAQPICFIVQKPSLDFVHKFADVVRSLFFGENHKDRSKSSLSNYNFSVLVPHIGPLVMQNALTP